MVKRARYFRWIILLITLMVEATAFWFGGPESPPGSSLTQSILQKLNHPQSWVWVGWASLSMAWLWAELAFSLYSNGRRTRSLLKRSAHEKLAYDTGVHWLVLLRDIHLNRLNDGEKAHLEDDLFPSASKRSVAWHAIWWPVILAALSLLYFSGWVAWSIRRIAHSSDTWAVVIQSKIQELSAGPFGIITDPLEQFFISVPQWLGAYYELIRGHTLLTIGVIFVVWNILRIATNVIRNIPLLPSLLRFGARLTVVIGVVSLLLTQWLDWLTPAYNFIPHHGLVAIGFIPLTLASAFYVPHILFWSSWRYAIVKDDQTFDATLITIGGVFNSLQQRINLQRIVDTDIRQWWWQRVFDIGDIELKQMGGGEAEKIRHIFGPNRMLDEIRNAIREGKKHSGQVSEFDGYIDEMDGQ